MIQMKIFIVNRNTPHLAKNQARQIREMANEIPKLKYRLIRHDCTEEPFKGKLHGHHTILQLEKEDGIDYYWFNHPDLSFAIDGDCLKTLLRIMEENPKIAMISPIEDTGRYISMRKEGVEWHPVATVDYLSLLIRGRVIDKIGFLNPVFEFSYGAIHEYSYKIYKNGWLIAYCDAAKMHHFGGTTYGGRDVVSRRVYKTHAREFAGEYLTRYYGKNWDELFASQLPPNVVNNYKLHKRNWVKQHPFWAAYRIAKKYKEIYINGPINWAKQRVFGHKFKDISPLKLNLGCGRDKKLGWVNIDIDWRYNPDVIADAKKLEMIPSNSVDEIESYHLFEHFTYYEAIEALKTWQRVLKQGGRLSMELPNFNRCINMLHNWNEPFDWNIRSPEMFAYGGIYGDAKYTTKETTGEVNEHQVHKYGWTFKHLETELILVGFKEIKRVPVKQTHRPSVIYDRDMRVECIK